MNNKFEVACLCFSFMPFIPLSFDPPEWMTCFPLSMPYHFVLTRLRCYYLSLECPPLPFAVGQHSVHSSGSQIFPLLWNLFPPPSPTPQSSLLVNHFCLSLPVAFEENSIFTILLVGCWNTCSFLHLLSGDLEQEPDFIPVCFPVA